MLKSAVNLAILSSLAGMVAGGSTCAVADSVKSDCGYSGIVQSQCEAKGCCWIPGAVNSETPWCFYAGPSADGYLLSSMAQTATGFTGILQLAGSGTAAYGADIKTLQLDIVFETDSIVRVKITDAGAKRWEVPESVVPRPHASAAPASTKYQLSYTNSPFTFEVTRRADGRSVFKMDSALVFKDQYLELSTSIDKSAKTFGLGESTRLNHALTAGSTYTMWAADIGAMSFDRNLYGSYPFYLQMVDGAAHGAMLMNSNGMDVTLSADKLTFKPIGGVLDLYVFVGSTPQEVVSQYTSIVGRPAMMPYWSLGFHNCRWGYESVAQVEDVVAKYAAAGIPLDTQWMDIDYMQDYRDFTLDAKDFPQAEVKSFVDKLHANGQRFVPIIDPGIMVLEGYDAYDRGLREGLFVKDLQGNNYGGKVWPGNTYFPDFLHPATQAYWTDQLNGFHNLVAVDGIWIDMNEVSNFCNLDGQGQVCGDANAVDCGCRTVDSSNRLDFPPYKIGNTQDTSRLGAKTIAASAVQYGNVSMYDAHNLYGLTEQMVTQQALKDIIGKRPFVLSRSSFLSTGVHSAKWTGDNAATWDDLRSSLISIMDFNLFGVPMIGADICGFNGDTNEELCARWIEVGAFYPFSRDHNAIDRDAQELYLWDSVAEAARRALSVRYQILPFFYTLFYQASLDGSMVVRALWANFPSDSIALGVQTQFMLGNALLVSPVLDKGLTTVVAYFPSATWYQYGLWQKDSVVDSNSVISSSAGVWRTLSAPLTTVNVHVRGGSVLPLQQAAMTTAAGRKTPFTLVAALCPQGKAFGSLFWDDGEQLDIAHYLTMDYLTETTSATAGYFSATSTHNNYADTNVMPVQEVVIVGAALQAPTSATYNGVPLAAEQFTFDAQRHTLRFSGLAIELSSSFKLEWK